MILSRKEAALRRKNSLEAQVTEFTKDMAETLADHFDAFSEDDTVELYITNQGVYIYNPHSKTPQFLGSAKQINPEDQLRRTEITTQPN